MQSLNDPQLYQNSQTVQKSSKSGIFSNKRLLVIKDGFLYYFSNVPSDYKGHVPNLMAGLKELPKSSIEIRSIQTIKLQSAKGSSLILLFLQKDMIDREDIRQSITSKNYAIPIKKNNEELQEWKFIFNTVNKCRQWYGALVKLKQFFLKQTDKFAEFMVNFDPQIRESVYFRNKKSVNLTSPRNNDQKSIDFSNSINQDFKLKQKNQFFEIEEENSEAISTPKDEKLKTPQQQTPFNNNYTSQILENKKDKSQIEQQTKLKELNSQTKKEQKVIQNFPVTQKQKQAPNQSVKTSQIISTTSTQPSKVIEPMIFRMEPVAPSKVESVKKLSNPKIQNQSKKIIESPSKKKLETSKDYNQQLKKKDELIQRYQNQLKQKQKAVTQMNSQVVQSKKIQQKLEQNIRNEKQKRQSEQAQRKKIQREKKQDESYRKLSQNQKPNQQKEDKERKKVSKEQSIQTENNNQTPFEIPTQRQSLLPQANRRPSTFSEGNFFSMNQRNTVTLFRNSTLDYSPSQNTSNLFDCNIYQSLDDIFYNQTTFSQKSQLQIKVVQQYKRLQKKSFQVLLAYLDESKPQVNQKFQKSIFEIELVCQPGKFLKINGEEKLVYNNNSHQRLKRQFKIYNFYFEKILKILKKRKGSFLIRVPFCFLFQYRGYSALIKFAPPRKSIAESDHQKIGKQLEIQDISCFQFSSFELSNKNLILMEVKKAYKITEDHFAIYKHFQYDFDFFNYNRELNISISSQKLLEENNFKEQTHRLQMIKMLKFTRELKKIMKSFSPFYDSESLEFFQAFLTNPQQIGNLIQMEVPPLKGLFVWYIERLLGIKLKNQYQKDSQQFAWDIIPVTRSFTFSSFQVNILSKNFDKYLNEQKFELAQNIIGSLKQMSHDPLQILIKESSLCLKYKLFEIAIEKINQGISKVSDHSPRKIELYFLLAECLTSLQKELQLYQCLSELVKIINYIYDSDEPLAEVYLMIGNSLLRQNQIEQAVAIYRKSIEIRPSLKKQIYLTFSKTLLYDRNSDPNSLIDFMNQFVQDNAQGENQKLLYHLGQLHEMIGNIPKALSYFDKCFGILIQSSQDHQSMIETFEKFIKLKVTPDKVKRKHEQLRKKINQKSNETLTAPLNNLVAIFILQDHSQSDCEIILQNLQKNQTQNEGIQAEQALEWNTIEKCLKMLLSEQSISAEDSVKQVFASFNHEYLSRINS